LGTSTSDNRLSYDEPTVEITLPGRRPVLYGHVTAERVAELVERQIVRGETAEGLIEA
jgi:NADP-reducing hydrogenase subunit HndB